MSSNRRRAVVTGVNYASTPRARLRGCIADATNMRDYLQTRGFEVICNTDEGASAPYTTREGILNAWHTLALDSHRLQLDIAVIHFSGHGSSIPDVTPLDERDGCDEVIHPSDFETAGTIRDDDILQILRKFNPSTKVVCIFDCCHSGTSTDMQFEWSEQGECAVKECRKWKLPNVITLSGCTDSTVSADIQVSSDAFAGAMTNALLGALRSKPELADNAFKLLTIVRQLVKGLQVPMLTSSYDLSVDPRLF